MALIKCVECGEMISSLANPCPRCGVPNPSIQRAGTASFDATNTKDIRGIFGPKQVSTEDLSESANKATKKDSASSDAAQGCIISVLIVIIIGTWYSACSGGCRSTSSSSPAPPATASVESPPEPRGIKQLTLTENRRKTEYQYGYLTYVGIVENTGTVPLSGNMFIGNARLKMTVFLNDGTTVLAEDYLHIAKDPLLPGEKCAIQSITSVPGEPSNIRYWITSSSINIIGQ